jgi:hypothetical protein
MANNTYEVPYAESGKDPLDEMGIRWGRNYLLIVSGPRDFSQLTIGEHQTTGTGLVLLSGANVIYKRSLQAIGTAEGVRVFGEDLTKKIKDFQTAPRQAKA